MAKAIAEKLLIKPETAVWVSDPAQAERIGPLPVGAREATGLSDATVGALAANARDLSKPAVLWVAYPKANRTDINRDTLWPIVGEFGMRPISQVAIDEVWSALRFRPLAEGEPPFTGGH